eukprot:366295-Chlamydomonas_euryale.AAC.1
MVESTRARETSWNRFVPRKHGGINPSPLPRLDYVCVHTLQHVHGANSYRRGAQTATEKCGACAGGRISSSATTLTDCNRPHQQQPPSPTATAFARCTLPDVRPAPRPFNPRPRPFNPRLPAPRMPSTHRSTLSARTMAGRSHVRQAFPVTSMLRPCRLGQLSACRPLPQQLRIGAMSARPYLSPARCGRAGLGSCPRPCRLAAHIRTHFWESPQQQQQHSLHVGLASAALQATAGGPPGQAARRAACAHCRRRCRRRRRCRCCLVRPAARRLGSRRGAAVLPPLATFERQPLRARPSKERCPCGAACSASLANPTDPRSCMRGLRGRVGGEVACSLAVQNSSPAAWGPGLSKHTHRSRSGSGSRPGFLIPAVTPRLLGARLPSARSTGRGTPGRRAGKGWAEVLPEGPGWGSGSVCWATFGLQLQRVGGPAGRSERAGSPRSVAAAAPAAAERSSAERGLGGAADSRCSAPAALRTLTASAPLGCWRISDERRAVPVRKRDSAGSSLPSWVGGRAHTWALGRSGTEVAAAALRGETQTQAGSRAARNRRRDRRRCGFPDPIGRPNGRPDCPPAAGRTRVPFVEPEGAETAGPKLPAAMHTQTRACMPVARSLHAAAGACAPARTACTACS